MTGWPAGDGTIPALVFCMDERSIVSNFFRLYSFFVAVGLGNLFLRD